MAEKKKGRIREYFRGVKAELKKVIWPNKKDTYRFTVVVIVMCAIAAIFFWVLDTTFLLLLEKALNISL